MSQSKPIYMFLGLILAFLCFSWSSARAIPSQAISQGSNPIRSWSARVSTDGWTLLDTLSADLVITDVTLSSNSECFFVMSNQNSSTSGSNFVSAYSNGTHMYQGHFQTGVLIPAGTSLYIHINRSSICNYTITGYSSH